MPDELGFLAESGCVAESSFDLVFDLPNRRDVLVPASCPKDETSTRSCAAVVRLIAENQVSHREAALKRHQFPRRRSELLPPVGERDGVAELLNTLITDVGRWTGSACGRAKRLPVPRKSHEPRRDGSQGANITPSVTDKELFG
jgi:hypothetical protein